MGFPNEVRQLHHAKLGGENIRQIVLPGIATGVGASVAAGGVLAYSAWFNIALAADIVLETLVTAVVLDTPSAAEIFTVDIGSCMVAGVNYANAAAVIAAVVAGTITNAQVHRAEVRHEVILIAADAPKVIPLDYPIYIPAGTGILGRYYTVAGGITIGVSIHCVQGY